MPSSIQVTKRLLSLIADEDSSDEQIAQAARGLLQSTHGTSASNINNVLEVISLGLDVDDPSRASVLMMVCGSLVELGAKTTPLHEPLIRQFHKLIEQSHSFHEAMLSNLPNSKNKDRDRATALRLASAELPDEAEAWNALEQSYPAGIALFSVSREARHLASRELASVRNIAEFHPGAGWLWKILQVLDDEPLLVIEPLTGLGIVGRMNGVSDNFQLNVLLMDVFPRGWFQRRRVSKLAANVARGIGPQHTDDAIYGVWNLYTKAALNSDGTLPDPKDHEADKTTAVWNEGIPADIPLLDGHRVVLLGPKSYIRTWHAQRDFNLLRADISKVRKLKQAEVENWLDRIRTSS